MNQLLHEIVGWLGYLQRGSVLFQILVILLTLVGARLLNRHFLRGALARWQGRSLVLVFLGLVALGLALSGHPFGLMLFLLALIIGWEGLALLRLGLARFLPPPQLRLLDTALIRPTYLLIAALATVRELDSVRDLAVIPLGDWFGSAISLGDLFVALLVIYLLIVGSQFPAATVAQLGQRIFLFDDGTRRALTLMIRYAAVGLGLLWVTDHLGFNRTALLTVAGGLSVGLGFGIKEVFSNFVSGLWLLFEGSVRPGEILYIDGDPCEVRRLGLRAAVLWRDRDNAELVIPNQQFFTSTTTTYTGSDCLRRSEVQVSAAYRHDPCEVIALLETVALATAKVLPQPPPKGLLLGYGDSAINYGLRYSIANPMHNASIRSEVSSAIWHAFREHGIEIPFPQRVLHATDTVEPGSDQLP